MEVSGFAYVTLLVERFARAENVPGKNELYAYTYAHLFYIIYPHAPSIRFRRDLVLDWKSRVRHDLMYAHAHAYALCSTPYTR